MTEFARQFMSLVQLVADKIDYEAIDAMAQNLSYYQKHGRLFIIGCGGSAANASHAVNDFRKLCGIEAYAPTDNVSELTARTNDEGWDTVFVEWLKVSKLSSDDAILFLSVGGGNREKNVSVNISNAVKYALEVECETYGIVGRHDGDVAKECGMVIVVPEVSTLLTTPMTEAFQAVIWHCLVSHPDLKINPTKW